ncbi:MAG: Ig-like domain-containing protein, partial [Planktothrix sp.]
TSPYNSGLEIDGKPLPEVTVEITEPTYDSGEIADGLALLFERIAESLRQMFKDTSLPIIGSLSGSEPAFIDTLKNNVVNAIKSTANLTQDKLEDLLKEKLGDIFPDVEVISSSLPEEIAFDIDLGNRYETTANLSGDFGFPALGLEVEGEAEANFEYGLDLKFGYHQDFGFFIDTEETQITADAFVGLDDNFNATATLGFLELNVANGAEDTENGGTKNTQAELNAKFALEDIDLNSEGNLIEDSGDGSRLTLTELKGFNTLRNNNQASLENLFDIEVEADAQVGLNARTSISGNAAIPSFNFELVGQFDALKVDGFKVTPPQTPEISFQNVEIDLGTFVNSFFKPIVKQVDKVLDPFRPLVDVLVKDTKLLSKIGLDGFFDKKLPTPNGGDGEVATIELADVILRALGNELPPSVFKFLETFVKVSNFIEQVNSLPAGENISIPLGDFTLPKLQDLSNLSVSEVENIAQNTASLQDDFDQILQTTTDSAKKQAAEFLKGFTEDLSLPNIDDILAIKQKFDLLENELDNIQQTTTDGAKKQAVEYLKNLIEDTSLPNLEEVPEIQQKINLLEAEFNNILQTTPDNAKKQAIELIQTFTEDLSLPNLEDILAIQQNINVLKDELENLLNTTPDSAEKQAIEFLTDFAERLPLSEFADFSKIDLDEIKKQAKDLQTELDKIIQNPSNSSQKSVTEFTKSVTFGDGSNEPLFDFPLLKNPTNAIALFLGQDVSLFTFDVPEVAFDVSVRKTFPIYGPIRGLLEGKFGASADFAIGMDTFGLRQWGAKDFALNDAYRVLDGFYISDRENADGTGDDVAEIKLNASIAAGAGLDVGVASGYVKGGIEGLFNLDLVDSGEATGTDDGRIHAISEIVPRYDDLLSLLGEVNAFLGAEVKILFVGTVYDKHFATFPLAKFKIGNSSIGKVQDGYIAGATVFLDANFNGIQDYADLNNNGIRDFDDVNNNGIRDTYSAPDLDTGETVQLLEPFSEPLSEASTFTNADGSYNLNIFDDFDTNGNGVIDADEGRIIVVNGVDTSTFLNQIVPLTTTPTATVTSPLTSIASQQLTPDFEAAKTEVENAFSLPAELDLFADIPIDVEIGVLALQVQLQNLVIAATRTISQTPFIGLEINSTEVKNQAGLLYLDSNSNNQFDTEEPQVISSRVNDGVRFLDLNTNEEFDEGEPSSPLTTAAIAKEIFQTVATLIDNGETPDLTDETVVQTLVENAISGLTQTDLNLNLDADILTTLVAEIIGKNQSIDSILTNTSSFLDETIARQQIIRPWVFFDANYNGVQDANEPFVYQQADGTNDLEIPVEQFDSNTNGRLDPNEGEIVEVYAFEPIELATGYSQLVKNPFETLVRLLAEPVNPEAAQTLVKTALNLPNVNLYEFDALKEISEGNAEALIVFTKQAQIYNTLVQLGQFFSTSQGNINEATNRILEEILGQINQPNGILNVSDATQIQAIIISINPKIEANVAAGAANIIAEGNIRIDEIVANDNLNLVEKATEIAKIQQVVQGETANDLQQVGAGTLSIEQAISNHTGATLTEKIQASTAENPTFQLDINNNNPVAETDENITILEDTETPINVLGNDQDDDSLTITAANSLEISDEGEITRIIPETTSQGGTVKIAEDGKTIIYTPALNYFGEDSFLYLITDSKGSVANAEVKLTVESVNDTPELLEEIPDQLNIQQNQTFSLNISGYFNDPDGDVLTYSAVALPNGLNINPTTGIISGIFTTNTVSPFAISVSATDTSNASVSDQFDLSIQNISEPTPSPTPEPTPSPTPSPEFDIFDPSNVIQAIAFPDLEPPSLSLFNSSEPTNNVDAIIAVTAETGIVFGLEGGDYIQGTENNDEINGNEDNDFIDAKNGNDTIMGGKNDDQVRSGSGNDWTFGNLGKDTLSGDRDQDWINGNEDEDLIDGAGGLDKVYGGKNNDQVRGGTEDDTLFGNFGADLMEGNGDNDILFGNQNNDTISGNADNDFIYGGQENDLLDGNSGDDVLFGDNGDDTLDGGEGDDQLTGGSGNDLLVGAESADTLTGGEGSDRFVLVVGYGVDLIADFVDGEDIIVLDGGLTFDQLTLTEANGSTVIEVNGIPLTILNNIEANLLTTEDFTVFEP